MKKRQSSIAEARQSLPTLVRDAEAGEVLELTRRGEPVAVLIGRHTYERLVAERPGFARAYETFTRQFDLAELAIDPTDVFGPTRDESPGRKVAL